MFSVLKSTWLEFDRQLRETFASDYISAKQEKEESNPTEGQRRET